jgi:hypothetical protein
LLEVIEEQLRLEGVNVATLWSERVFFTGLSVGFSIEVEEEVDEVDVRTPPVFLVLQ